MIRVRWDIANNWINTQDVAELAETDARIRCNSDLHRRSGFKRDGRLSLARVGRFLLNPGSVRTVLQSIFNQKVVIVSNVFEIPFHIDGSASDETSAQSSWQARKSIKLCRHTSLVDRITAFTVLIKYDDKLNLVLSISPHVLAKLIHNHPLTWEHVPRKFPFLISFILFKSSPPHPARLIRFHFVQKFFRPSIQRWNRQHQGQLLVRGIQF